MPNNFLGLGGMNREDQLRVGLVAVLVLALECVLEGLVTESILRGWIFHAFAVGLSVWALFDLNSLAVRLASAAGVVAVGNEALLISEANASMRYLIPGSVLFFVSGWVFQRSVSSSVAVQENVWMGDHPINASTALSLEMPPPPPPNQLQKLAPFIIGSGSLLVLYGIFFAPWVSTITLFGLLSENLNLSQVSSNWANLGAGDGISEFVASGIQIFSVVALLISAIGVFSSINRQLVIFQPIKLVLTALIAFISLLQVVVIARLISADADLRVLVGAWMTPIGLSMAGIGFWMSAV